MNGLKIFKKHASFGTSLLFLSLTLFLAINVNAFAKGLPDFTELVESSSPAVVNIRTIATQGGSSFVPGFPNVPQLDENDPMYEFFKRFFPPNNGGGQRPAPPQRGGPPNGGQPRGVGSGFFISSDGFVLSNHHVVAGADKVVVTMADRREFSAKIIGSDQRTDVALLKIEGSGFPYLTLGNPEALRVGEWVLAIGSPFGLANTVTAGIVSALGRDTGDYLPFIQTDVAVNPGNSGGPLINLKGEVIGINSQIYSRTGGFMGISFAIPIDEAELIAAQLKKEGKVVRGRIGVMIGEVSKDVAEALGFPSSTGALVRSVDPDGPSAKAGIKPGDIVLSFQRKKIERVSDLPRTVGGTKPGTKARMMVWRGGKQIKVTVTVEELKSASVVASNDKKPRQVRPKTTVFNWLGLSVADLPENISKRLNIEGGVVISSTEGVSRGAGLLTGDIITSVNNKNIVSVSQFRSVLKTADKGKVLVFLIRRGEEALFVPVNP
jgi:serine protease Do